MLNTNLILTVEIFGGGKKKSCINKFIKIVWRKVIWLKTNTASRQSGPAQAAAADPQIICTTDPSENTDIVLFGVLCCYWNLKKKKVLKLNLQR